LVLHADNGNAMRAATLESRLEELGILRSFSRPRVSNDNPYSESLFRTVKYRPDYPPQTLLLQRSSLSVGRRVRRLVQPPTPPQRDQIRDTPATSRRVRPWRSAATALSSMNEPDSSIRGDGHDQPGVGVNRRWFGSISRRKSSMNQGSYR